MSKCIAIIPARGASKRIPRKNIKSFNGKPLISYSIEIAIKSNLFDRVIVSTDDEEIKRIAIAYGAEVPFLRPKELSDDFTGTQEVINDVVNRLALKNERYDYVCTIYATAPFLNVKYLKEAFDMLKKSDAKNAFSCTSMPYPIQRTFKIDDRNRCEMFWPENFSKRSQDLEEAYQDAGQFYFEKLNHNSNEIIFGKDSIPIILPRYLVQDIDTLEDWKEAEIKFELLKQRNSLNILFLVDSSSKIGTGHIMRSLVLANSYRDSNIIFACQKLDGNINHKVKEASYHLEEVNSIDIHEINKLINKHNIEKIVIDNYGINYDYERKLKKENKDIQIMCFDDTYERHYCDILLNHNICANENRYRKLLPKKCELRCGKEYTLLREEFYLEKSKKKAIYKKGSILNIFIMFGGADIANLNKKVLKVLSKYNNIKVNIITTTANKKLNGLKDYCHNKKWVKLHINSANVAKLIRKSHFAIVTPSVILNEIFFMNVPFIAIKVASNQKDMYEYLKKNKYFALKEYKKEKLIKAIDKITFNFEGY